MECSEGCGVMLGRECECGDMEHHLIAETTCDSVAMMSVLVGRRGENES